MCVFSSGITAATIPHLTAMSVCYCAVSGGQESSRGSAGFSAQELTRLQAGYVLIGGSAGKRLLLCLCRWLAVAELTVTPFFVVSRREGLWLGASACRGGSSPLLRGPEDALPFDELKVQ